MNKQDHVGVTIITPAFCRVAGLKRAIESVDAQTYQDWQHLIVHDGPAPLDLYEMVIGHSDTRRKLIELGQDTLVSGLCQMKGNGPALAGWLFAAHLIALLTGLRQWLLCLASEHTEDSPMLARLRQVLLHGGVVKLQEEGSENFTIKIFVDPEPVEESLSFPRKHGALDMEAKLDRPHAPILERHGCEQG